MVPDRFNMVDMGGIDIIYSQGLAVPGLYNKLVESHSTCRYTILYNWSFNQILIAPSYQQLVVTEEYVLIGTGIKVKSDDTIEIHSLEIEPTLESLEVTENGEYTPPVGVDGFDSVNVDVPPYIPVIEPITITENGVYEIPYGVDGYGPITVNVSQTPHRFIASVEGGYNGGAVVTVVYDNTSEQLISAVGDSPYNLRYTPNSASATIDDKVVSIAIPDLPTNISMLIIQVTFGGVTKSVSFSYAGSNTSYGYGSQTADIIFY